MINAGSISDVGSLAWANAGGPPLTTRQALSEYLAMGSVVMRNLPHELHYALSKLGLAPARKLTAIAFPELPKTDAVAVASEVLASYCEGEPAVLAHSYRSTYIALSLGRVDQKRVDEEVLAVAMLLHDVGLCPRAIHDESANEFTVRGARIATRMLSELHWSQERIDHVAQIITLHPSSHVSEKRWGSEAHYGRLAPVCDGFGEAWRLPKPIAEEIFARHPIDPTAISDVIAFASREEARRQPGGRFSLLKHVFPPLVRVGCQRWTRL